MLLIAHYCSQSVWKVEFKANNVPSALILSKLHYSYKIHSFKNVVHSSVAEERLEKPLSE